MSYLSFNELLPDIANKETRVLTFASLDNDYRLPPDRYIFIKFFCTDKHCDCRRSIIKVLKESEDKIVAEINYGWESLVFYEKWMGTSQPDMIEGLHGISTNVMGCQTIYTDKLVKLFTEMLDNDIVYKNRIEEHYKLFRKKINGK